MMRRLYHAVFFFCALAASCSARNGDTSVTGSSGGPADSTGGGATLLNDCADKIALFYGGRCEARQRAETGPYGGQRILSLTLSDSKLMDSLRQFSYLTGSNMAYIFSRSLPARRLPFDVLESRLRFAHKKTDTFRYTARQLDAVVQRMRKVEYFVSLLAKDDTAGLLDLFDGGPKEFREEALVARLLESKEALGTVRGFVPYGFSFYGSHLSMLADSSPGLPTLEIAGRLTGSKKQAYCYFIMSPDDIEAIWYADFGRLSDD